MSIEIETSYSEPSPRPARLGDLCVPDLVDLLGGIVASAEPAVVFLSAVQLCVPGVCVSAVAAVAEAGDLAYRLISPRERWGPRATRASIGPARIVAFGGIEVPPNSVVTDLSGPATAVHSAYEGVLVMTFDRPDLPADRLTGQLVADRAAAVVTIERLQDIAAMHRAHGENLEAALRSSRDIGIALGIIMSQYRLLEGPAFDMLRTRSQDTQRKVRELAADIAYAGAFEAPEQALAGRSGAGS